MDEDKSTMLEGSKPAIDSGTIIASGVALIAWFVSIWGHEMSQFDIVQLTEAGKNAIHAGADLVGVLATIAAIYKRYTATEKIEGVFRTPEKK